jgi:hypothetical protein
MYLLALLPKEIEALDTVIAFELREWVPFHADLSDVG